MITINYDNPQACILTINGRLNYNNRMYGTYGTIAAIRTGTDGQNHWLYITIPNMSSYGWFSMFRVRFYPSYLDLYFDNYVGTSSTYPVGQITSYEGFIY